MIKFYINDIVKYTSGNYDDEENNPLWGGDYGEVSGKIISIDNSDDNDAGIQVAWENGEENSYSAHDLELIHRPIRLVNTKKLNEEYVKYDKISRKR